MKILFAAYHNPHFLTVTEYVEMAIRGLGHQLIAFEDRKYVLPGTIRDSVALLESWDVTRINNLLISQAQTHRPDIFIAFGGYRILSKTIDTLKTMGIKTVLWTTDPPQNSQLLVSSAEHYDFIFCQGTEAVEIFSSMGISHARLLPMACIPDIHTRKDVSDEERRNYKCDVAFVGSLNPSIYPFRIQTLEHLSGLNLSIWGPGSRLISENSPLYKHVRGTQVSPDIWTKIYSCAKIVLCMHYKDPRGTVACYQSSPRVFEALSCGAFLIVDEQKDVMSLFENERHLVYFHNADDLRQKIQYYLSHGEKRENIAKNGYTFVRENHTYAHRIKELLSNIEGHE